MRLTRLEINGFKSFARKTELQFGQGITAVIGPNGSGKSNIADAIRWVLGEQSARALRGTRMEDVIFSGTEARRAQSFCEVALTFDNTGGELPIDFAEVTVIRRVYRSGESEYMINRNPCRLKDIHELFRDTGIGKEGYSIIGQGRVEEILSNKSGDRRAAFEEAAGVMRYRVRKEEAERKLDHTEKNITRLTDILGELETQLGPLEEQSKEAQQYLALRDELKDLEINAFLIQHDKYTERIAAQTATIGQLNDEEARLSEMERTLGEDVTAREEELRNLEQSISALQNELLQLMSGAEGRVGEYNVLGERIANLIRERERLSEEIGNMENRERELSDTLQAMGDGGEREQARIREMDARIAAAQEALAALEAEIDREEERLEEQKNSIMEAMNSLSDARSDLSRLEAMKTAFESRLAAIGVEEGEIQRQREALLAEQNEAEQEQAALREKSADLRAKQAEILNEQAQAAAKSNELQQALATLAKEGDTLRSRRNVLEEMAKAHEGYYASVRNILRDCERNIDLRRAVLGVVAEIIGVPEEYETALEMSLGSALQNIVTPTPEDGKRVIEHLRKNQYGRATMLPVSAMRPRLLSREEREYLNMPGCIGVASELVRYEPRYRSVVENLLGRTVLVETLDAGIAINKRAGAAFRIATLRGDIIHPGGSMTGGSVQKREFSLLGREREIRELTERIAENEKRHGDVQKETQAQQAVVSEIAERLSQMAEALHQQDIEDTRQEEKLDMIRRDVAQNEDRAARSALEREQIGDNLADIAEERAEAERRESGIEAGSAATQEDVQNTQKAIAALRKRHDEANAALGEDRVQRMAREKEADAAKAERARLTKELEQTGQARARSVAAVTENEKQRQSFEDRRAELQREIGREQADVDARKEQQRAMDEERGRQAAALSELRARKDEIAASIRDTADRRHRQELNKSRAELELAAMQERIFEDYELTYETAAPLRRQIAVSAAHTRIDEIKEAIRALGSINVNAIEDYRTVSARFKELSGQCDDLNRAQGDLNTLIGELTATMQRQFLSQFRLIQENFTVVFRRLFGGGYAQLRLSDEKDVLNCDIDIIAQPPGKKLQLLSLLSGGERALTAIALLFAMLKLKPTAFCVLDEIESSLDEVNVTRFANYLKSYAEDTQFIIITHRKGSMEVCNTLYGVAMEEKGVSKVVSARFTDPAAEAG